MLGLLLVACLLAGQATSGNLTLEIRVFLSAEEVTGESRVILHRAGDRGSTVAQSVAVRHLIQVPPGIYDAQIVRERDGRVLNIRWAERLVVMPYPDEGGRHLEVVNFTNGYGALQVRTAAGAVPNLGIYPAGERSRPVAGPAPHLQGDPYVLFVVPAGRYDMHVKSGDRPTWHPDIEVPLDRTRLWLIP